MANQLLRNVYGNAGRLSQRHSSTKNSLKSS